MKAQFGTSPPYPITHILLVLLQARSSYSANIDYATITHKILGYCE